jgi:PAS domain S-box-containing protein
MAVRKATTLPAARRAEVVDPCDVVRYLAHARDVAAKARSRDAPNAPARRRGPTAAHALLTNYRQMSSCRVDGEHALGPELESDIPWRAVVEHVADGVMLTALDGRILAANPAACALLGRGEDELRAAGRAAVVVADEAAGRFIDERRRAGRARGAMTLRRKDGSTFLADVSSTVFLGQGGEPWTSLTFRDVTEAERRRHALEILVDAGRVLASSLDPAATLKHLTDLVVPRLADVCTVDLVGPDGVARVAVAHREPSCVGAFEQVRRRAIKPDASAGVDYVLRSGEPSCVFELGDEWLRSATLDRRHFEAARALGVRSFVSVPLAARSTTIGALTLMSAGVSPPFGEADLPLVRALGELAAAALDNAHCHAEAIEARRLRDDVLGAVAHDLRGPLNAIALAIEALAGREGGAEAEIIRRAVGRAELLIRDLLTASKAEAGLMPLERRPASLASIVDEVYVLHSPLAKAKSLRFEASVDGAPPHVVVDRHRVVQLLSNLVTNAIKFTPPGGRVDLRSRADASVVFTVADSGVGIPDDERCHIFERFWQGAHARRVGAGLGLSIARGIAEAHGGSIAVESALGRGTTFTVTLPRS